jgi:hypothetical protein
MEHPLEFKNFVEIVNDVLSRLHERDRAVIDNASSGYLLLSQQWHWQNHIRTFYLLNHPEHPLTNAASPRVSPDEISARIIGAVFDALHRKYEDLYA